MREHHMPSQAIPTRHEDDLESELQSRRYDMALRRLTVSDVLSVIDDMVRTEADERKHPLFALVRHSLRFGTYRTSGKHAHVAALLGAVYEDLIEEAIERLVQEELSNFGPWED
jgi:hypothetical protein